MESKYTRRLLDVFPKTFKLVDDINDPLHIIADSASTTLTELERIRGREINNLFIDSGDPVQPSGVFYISLGNINMNEIHVDVGTGDAVISPNASDFMSDRITGFDFVSEINPSGIEDDINGISYGFDWEDPLYYIAPSGSDFVYAYSDLEDIYVPINYTTTTQSYDENGADEYIQFEYEISASGTPDDFKTEFEYDVPGSGVAYTYRSNVAYLEHTPIDGTVVIMDILNLEDPTNPDSDGIVVSEDDYIVSDDKVIFATNRSDYSPATITEISPGLYNYTYPTENPKGEDYPVYQPDAAFTSTFIVEYDYIIKDSPRCLTHAKMLHNLGVKANPEASY